MGEEGYGISKMTHYGGSNYGVGENYGDPSPIDHHMPVGSIALTTNPQTANQLREVMNQLSSGTKAVEINLLTPQVSEAIPNQHLDEIRRLSKLVGAEFNVHGPTIEPTGMNQQGKWDEGERQQAERQMWNALEQAHRISPDRNVVVTFHSSNGLPEPETKEKIFNKEKNKWEVVTTSLGIVNELTGQINVLPAKINKNHFTGEEPSAQRELQKYNKDQWLGQVANTNIELQRATEQLRVLSEQAKRKGENKMNEAADLFKLARDDPEKYAEEFKKMEELDTKHNQNDAQITKQLVQGLSYAENLTRDAYRNFQNLFNEAYEAAEKTKYYGKFAQSESDRQEAKQAEKDLERLQKLRDNILPTLRDIEKKPEKTFELAEHVEKGIQVLGSLEAPKQIRELRHFALDKASDTFGNLAFKAYETWNNKKTGEAAPIISIENPPTGMGLSRAEDLKALIELSQEKFVANAVKKGMDEYQAKREAKKLIGATWDVGHINMIRKRGFDKDDVVKETELIAPHVKNIHMSDNFGMDHTELPMGMGNVPMQEHLAKLKAAHGEKLDKIKKIVETGHWYTHFKTNPFAETIAAFGSPMYGMTMAPYWNQNFQQMGSYFGGYGMNPDTHHSMYGAGFSALPVELGGQIQGKSRLSGTPME